jgi:hypothetical protein
VEAQERKELRRLAAKLSSAACRHSASGSYVYSNPPSPFSANAVAIW